MADHKLTEAQVRTLKALQGKGVRWERYGARYYSLLPALAPIRNDVVRRLVQRGLAEVGRPCDHPTSSHFVVLTDAGREALREWEGK